MFAFTNLKTREVRTAYSFRIKGKKTYIRFTEGGKEYSYLSSTVMIHNWDITEPEHTACIGEPVYCIWPEEQEREFEMEDCSGQDDMPMEKFLDEIEEQTAPEFDDTCVDDKVYADNKGDVEDIENNEEDDEEDDVDDDENDFDDDKDDDDFDDEEEDNIEVEWYDSVGHLRKDEDMGLEAHKSRTDPMSSPFRVYTFQRECYLCRRPTRILTYIVYADKEHEDVTYPWDKNKLMRTQSFAHVQAHFGDPSIAYYGVRVVGEIPKYDRWLLQHYPQQFKHLFSKTQDREYVMNVCEHPDCGAGQGWYFVYHRVNELIRNMTEIEILE